MGGSEAGPRAWLTSGRFSRKKFPVSQILGHIHVVRGGFSNRGALVALSRGTQNTKTTQRASPRSNASPPAGCWP